MLHIVESTKPMTRLIADLEQAVAGHTFGVLDVHDLRAKMAEKGVPPTHWPGRHDVRHG